MCAKPSDFLVAPTIAPVQELWDSGFLDFWISDDHQKITPAGADFGGAWGERPPPPILGGLGRTPLIFYSVTFSPMSINFPMKGI
jgi:hypothetical protein